MDLSFQQVVTILQGLVAAGVALLLVYELALGRTAFQPRVSRKEDPSRYWRTVTLHACILAAVVYMAVE